VRAALVATLVNGVLHVVYHAGHVDMFSTGDQVAIIASLVLAPLVAIVLLATFRGVETPVPAGERVADGAG
jgi:uncharacterized YccA/Bax inhibitor family protein